MNVYYLGRVPWLESQLLYHALPRVGGAGLILIRKWVRQRSARVLLG